MAISVIDDFDKRIDILLVKNNKNLKIYIFFKYNQILSLNVFFILFLF
jgi:hypothetical protein